jgi:succinoglycan biosynthesis protein ExoA
MKPATILASSQLQPTREKTSERPSTLSEVPFVSVIVPVRNEEAHVRDTLVELLHQDYDPESFEILVVDGRSTDATREVVRALQEEHPHLRLLDNPRQWSSAGRNVAIKDAQGDLFVIIDGHCQLNNPCYLSDLAAAFARSKADCIGRPQPLDICEATPLQRAIALARASRLGHHPDSHIYSDREGFVPPQSVAIAYRRSVFNTIGLFDESFDACEDVEFNHRLAQANLRCFLTPAVQVHYHPRSSLPRLFRQMIRYGRGRVRLLRKHPDTSSSLAGFAPGALVAGTLLGPLACLLFPPLWLFYFAVLGLYTALLLAFSVGLACTRREPLLLPLFPLVFATVHYGAGTGQCLEAILGGSKRRRGKPKRSLSSEAEKIAATPTQAAQPTVAERACEKRTLNALTIDVEDYYQVSAFDHCVSRDHWEGFEQRVEGSTQKILDLLSARGVPGTFFILGWVAERYPGLVRAIHQAGHEVGCHGYGHQLIYQQTPEVFRADLCRARDVLEDILGQRITAYRAPSFSITRNSLWALDILIEEGFTLDSSIYPVHHDRYGLPGAPAHPWRVERPAGSLWEFPPPVWRFLRFPFPVGGGGYFRLYPYAFTRKALRDINASGRPFALYLHPWEFDPDQPRLRTGRLRALRHYLNLHRTEERLNRVLEDFSFATLSEALEQYQPEAKPSCQRWAA